MESKHFIKKFSLHASSIQKDIFEFIQLSKTINEKYLMKVTIQIRLHKNIEPGVHIVIAHHLSETDKLFQLPSAYLDNNHRQNYLLHFHCIYEIDAWVYLKYILFTNIYVNHVK